MTKRALALLALLLPAGADEEVAPLASNPSVAAHVLSSTREELRGSRRAFRRLSPDDRGVVKKARDAVAKTPEWRAVAPAFCAAADILEAASAGKGDAAALCGHMARTYRAMAEEVDGDATYLPDELKERAPAERAEATLAEAEKLLAAAAEGTLQEMGSVAWDRVKRADPRYRALVSNMRTLARGYAALSQKEHEEKLAGAIAKAAKLHGALEPYFTEAKAEEPEEAPPPAPRGGYGG